MVLWIHRRRKGSQNTLRRNTSSLFECVWIPDARVIHATMSLQKAEQSAWSLSNDDTRMSMASPPSLSLPVAPFQTKKKCSRGQEKMRKRRKSHSFLLEFSRCKMSYNSHIRIQSLFLIHTHTLTKTHSLSSFLDLFSACKGNVC